MRRKIEDTQEPAQELTEPIHVKYRPSRLRDVIGQDSVIRSLEQALKAKARAHAFLFTGPPGTGKTTLARIVLAENGCMADAMIEVDAASNSGIDDMRAVTSTLRYNGFGATPNKGIIIDECHGLSKQAWDSLLKSVEEPPPHVFFAFCSTNPSKIPEAIVTRCQTYNLKPVRFDDLMDLLEEIAQVEGYDVPERVLGMIAQAAEGSPRAALTMLAKVQGLDDENEIAELLATPLENKEIIDLCRLMLKGDLEWRKLTETLKRLTDSPESIRIVIANYLAGCLMNPKGSEKEIVRILGMLEEFNRPFNSSDKMAPLLVAFGRIIFP